MKHIVAISPHADDAEYGCGGTLAKCVEDDCYVRNMVFSDRVDLEIEVRKAGKILGLEVENRYLLGRVYNEKRQDILQTFYDYAKSYSPDIVFVPSTNDIHQDHQVITQEAIRAFRRSTILGYIHPWDNLRIDEICIVPLQKHHIDKKIEALEVYKSQRNKPYFKNLKENVYSIARINGLKILTDYAETFEVIKMVGI